MTTDEGFITVHLVQDPKHDRCSYCQSPDVIRHGTEERTVRMVPIGGKPVELRLPVPRLGCRNCGMIRQVAIRFARVFRRFSHDFERYALNLLSHMTIQAVADHLRVGWDSIQHQDPLQSPPEDSLCPAQTQAAQTPRHR
ncbi:MAG TPA: transposase family protein [Gemmataceae bacterium]|jgi:transposase|nr:transposase family protein [Gemmataceae bacterium]